MARGVYHSDALFAEPDPDFGSRVVYFVVFQVVWEWNLMSLWRLSDVILFAL